MKKFLKGAAWTAMFLAVGLALLVAQAPVQQANGPWTMNLTQIAGAAIATAASGIAKFGLTDASGNGITSTGNALDVNLKTPATLTVQGGLSDNNAAPGSNNIGALMSLIETQFPSGQNSGDQALERQTKDGMIAVAVQPSIYPAAFRATVDALAPASSATDIACLPGNATNTDVVTKVVVSGTQTTAGIIDLQILTRSTADSSGTHANMTVAALDQRNSANSVPLSYTANPTTGSLVGNADNVKIGMMAPGTATPDDIYIGNFANRPIRLSGIAQEVCVNLGGVTVTGGSVDVTFEWLETTLP